MAVRVPLLLRRLRPALAHFVHSLPLVLPCPAVLTVQDLSFERDALADGLARDGDLPDRRAALGPSRARACSRSRSGRRTTSSSCTTSRRRRSSSRRSRATPAFRPGGTRGDYLLLVGSVEERKDPLLAAEAAPVAGRPLVVVGPGARRVARRRAPPARRRRARLRRRRTSSSASTRRRRRCSSRRGTRASAFPSLEAMACGTPVVATRRPGGAGGRRATRSPTPSRDAFARRVVRVLADPEPWSRAGLERARVFSWDRTAALTVEVYRQALA